MGKLITVHAQLYKAHHSCAIKIKCAADKTTATRVCVRISNGLHFLYPYLCAYVNVSA